MLEDPGGGLVLLWDFRGSMRHYGMLEDPGGGPVLLWDFRGSMRRYGMLEDPGGDYGMPLPPPGPGGPPL